MGFRILHSSLLIALAGLVNCLFAQSSTDPSVIITDHNGNSGSININCDYIFNPNHCITLNAQYTEIKNPTDYSVSSITFAPIGDFSEGTEIVIDKDDKWSTVQRLPFNFCFYGKTFNSFVVGDNGVISFDTELAGTECPYTIAGSIPSTELIHNTIFGVYHDLTNDSDVFGCTNDCGKVTYYVTGTAPYRKAIINYDRMNHFGCEDTKSTTQIVLYETTNIVEVYIKDKPFTCDIGNEKRALVGISNSDGTRGISPAGRNTGIWEAHDEAWRFLPQGNSVTTIKWLDASHNEIGSGNSIQVCPTQSTSYSVEVTYQICTPVTISSSIQIIYSPEYPTAKDVIHNECFEGNTPNKTVNFEALIPEAIGNQTGVTTSLHYTLQDAMSGANPVQGLDNYLMTTVSQTFYLRVQRGANCWTTSSLTINLKKTPIITEGNPFIVCDEDDDGSESIYLPNYNTQINGYESWMKMEYYNSYNEAVAGTNPITTLVLSNTMTIYVKASNPDSKDCYSIIPVTFILQPTIKAESITVTLCDNDLNGTEVYDLTSYENTIPDHIGMSFSYYLSEQDALSEQNSILNPGSYSVSNGTVIYVKIKKDGFCPLVKTITFSFTSTSVNNISDAICNNQEQTVINLMNYYNQMVGTANVALDGFYLSYEGAVNKDPNQLITNPQSFTINNVDTTIYVRFTDNSVGCNFIREIEIHFIRSIEKQPVYNVCDSNNDGQEMFQLSTLTPIFQAGYPPSTVTYYATLNDYNSGTNPITQILVTNETTVYVKLEISGACSFLYQIKLKLVPLTVSATQNVSVCDNQNDNVENYNLAPLITILGIQNYESVRFYESLGNAYNEINAVGSYFIFPNHNLVYVRVNYSNRCSEIIPVYLVLIESVKVSNLTPIRVCDTDGNNSEIIDLTSVITQSGVDLSKVKVEFYTSLNGAETQNTNEQIQNITSFEITRSTLLYVRFQNISTGCFTTRQLVIQMDSMPKVLKTTLSVCDFGNDVTETITLQNLNEQLVANTSGFTFTYYLTEEDANNSVNAITSYTLTSSTSLYVKVSSGPGCYVIRKINFTFSIPPTVYNQTVEICDNNADDEETVNLTLYQNLLTGNTGITYNFRYFTTYDNAYNNTQPINNPTSYTIQNFSDSQTIYVRITDGGGCFSIAELTFKPAEKIMAKNEIAHLCDINSDMQEYINLTQYIPDMLLSSEQNLTIKYYRTENGAISQNPQDLVSDPTNYSVTLTQGYVWVRFNNSQTGCHTIRFIEINLQPLPKLVNGTYLVCDDNFDNSFTLNLDELKYVVILNPDGYTFTYYHTMSDAMNNTNKIENYQNYTVSQFDEDIFVKAENQYGCSSIKKVTLYTQNKIPVTSQNVEINNCDDNFDGITSFNLNSVTSQLTSISGAQFEFYSTLTDAQNQTNPITNSTNYQNIQSNTDKVYVRISSAGYCPSLGIINLTVLALPPSSLEKELKICPNSTLTLDAGSSPEIHSYLWSTGETTQTIIIDKTGTYQVTITGTNGCKATYTTQVTEYSPIIIADLIEGDDYITVIAEGPPPLEYSMNNSNWQSDNTFRNLEPGIYTFYVRSKSNGCISTEKKGVIFKVNNVITPNGDGKNDTWKMCDLENFDSRPSRIQIFDRYGKEVYSQTSNTCFTWDGFYLGRPLPTTSYWYIIHIADGRQYTGWIMLRNYDESFH